MAEEIKYYAMRLSAQKSDEPTGLARRRILDDGGVVDEALKRNLRWGHTPVIVGWDRGDLSVELEEITEEEANRLIERFRADAGDRKL